MIFYVSRLRVHFAKQTPLCIDPRHEERSVPRQIVVFEIEVVANQCGAQIGVVSNPIAANPGIHQGESQQEQNEQQS